MATAQIGKLPRLPKERDLEMDGTPKEKGTERVVIVVAQAQPKLPPDIS